MNFINYPVSTYFFNSQQDTGSFNLLKLQVDVQQCDLRIESWGTTADKMQIQWDKRVCWVNPKLNNTLNKHTVNARFFENKAKLSGDG